MNDIKDIRENPEKYRQMMINRRKDPAEIDEVLRLDKGSRIGKTLTQNRSSQANIDTQLWELYAVTRKKPMTDAEKEVHASMLREKLAKLQEEERVLTLQMLEWLQQDAALEIEQCDRDIAKAEAKVAECNQKGADILAALTPEQTSALEEICEEIKRTDYFLQKGRGEGSTSFRK